MEFSNVLSINDIINTIVLIFSCVSILLTYFTLKEMKKQRNISMLPNIFIKYESNIEYDTKNVTEQKPQFNLLIGNNGNGIAKNINCNLVICDIENKDFTHIESNAYGTLYKFKDYYALHGSPYGKRDFFIQTLQNSDTYDLETRGIEIAISCIAKSLLESHNTNISNEELLDEYDQYCRHLVLNVSYTDIIENQYNITFDLNMEVSALNFKNNIISYELKLNNMY